MPDAMCRKSDEPARSAAQVQRMAGLPELAQGHLVLPFLSEVVVGGPLQGVVELRLRHPAKMPPAEPARPAPVKPGRVRPPCLCGPGRHYDSPHESHSLTISHAATTSLVAPFRRGTEGRSHQDRPRRAAVQRRSGRTVELRCCERSPSRLPLRGNGHKHSPETLSNYCGIVITARRSLAGLAEAPA